MLENTTEEFNDFRYILDNLTELAVGSRYRYEELADNIDLSYKYRCIIKRCIEPEVDPSITLESHFYCMTRDSKSYEVYHQLHAKARCYVWEEKPRLFGSSGAYTELLLPVEDLVAMSAQEKQEKRLLIAEIQLQKMRLMSYAM